MVKILIGDLFESNTSTLVNTVNCVGVMGKGIAQSFKKRFPEMFDDYVLRCKEKRLKVGEPYLYTTDQGLKIINFPTKMHWRSPSKLDDIIKGLNIFLAKYKVWGICSVAFPPLGCGNGGLEWQLVGPIMYEKLSEIDIQVEIYAPYGTPHQLLEIDYLNKSIRKSNFVKFSKQEKLRAEWIALIEIIYRLQNKSYTNPVGRTIFQKICYIFTELDVNTGFKFKQASYGPFSDEIKEVINILANNNLINEQQLGKMTALKVGEQFLTLRNKYIEQINVLEKKITKTVDLFSRIRSTKQAEIVTTILFSSRELKKIRDNEISEQDVYNYIMKWKKSWNNKDQQEQVISGIRNLEMLNWLKLNYSESLKESYL